MASTKLLLLVLCFAVYVGMSRSWVEDVVEQNTGYLSDWARNTFSQNLGSENNDATQNMKHKAEDAASRATDTALGSESASQKAADAKEAIGSDEVIRMATDKATDHKASNIGDDVKNDVKGGMGCGGDDDYAFGVYDEAKDEVSEASMSEEAKARYEAAKEKASDATGNLGAKMRNTP